MALLDPYQNYLTAGTSFARLAPFDDGNNDYPSKNVYGLFNEGRDPLLPFVDTGLIFCGNPSVLKYFNEVKFSGNGKIYVRALVDSTEVARGYTILSQDPNIANVFRLPRGTAGYGLRLQLTGIAWWRHFEINWDEVHKRVKS